MLKAGSLQAMTKGSRFSIYALGSDSKTGSPMAQAEIVNSWSNNIGAQCYAFTRRSDA